MRRIKPEYALAALALGLAAILFVLHSPLADLFSAPVPVNFEVPLLARDRMLQGLNPYIPNELLPYKYSPFATIPYMLLPKGHGAAWIDFKIFCLSALVAVLLFGIRPVTWKRVGLAALGALLAWKGFASTLFYGQLEIALLFLAFLAALLLRRSFFLAGLVIGVMPWLKIPLAFLFLPFFAEAARQGYRERSFRKPLFLATGIGLTALLCGVVLPLAVFGVDATVRHTRAWIDLLKTQPRELYEEPLNQSLWMALQRWFGPAGASLPAKLAALVAVAAAALALIRSRALDRAYEKAPLAWITPWLLLNHLINPLAWMWGSLYVLGVPLALELVDDGQRRGAASWAFRALLLLAAVGWMLQQRPFHALLGFANWEDVFPYANMTAFWLALLAAIVLSVSSKRRTGAVA